ncbi:alpha-L-fucosidase [Streptomyces sp. NBC_01320]|uniref:alpha-L-fucosidase n=1 Tax=Streptomyces sp. NBC_01320 TaxID=2903824 RepID=UPI002E143BA8|nr:alpha-L-fucosidase [Streptomyces sp. NBC_01320]
MNDPFLHGQVRELCANYGKLDILWFDFSYNGMGPWFDFSYKGMGPEEWGAAELVRMVRELQPDVIMDNRLETSGEGMGSIVTDEPTTYCGDFVSPEQVIPVEGFHTPDGTPVPWKACTTLNNNWGYFAGDELWKSPEQMVTKLVECVAKGGNLLLNVGPDRHGTIQPDAVERLREIGGWLAVNGESVYGAGPAGLGTPEWLLHPHRLDGVRARPASPDRPAAADRCTQGPDRTRHPARRRPRAQALRGMGLGLLPRHPLRPVRRGRALHLPAAGPGRHRREDRACAHHRPLTAAQRRARRGRTDRSGPLRRH